MKRFGAARNFMDKRQQAKIAMGIVGVFLLIALGALLGASWLSLARGPLALVLCIAAAFVVLQLGRNLRS